MTAIAVHEARMICRRAVWPAALTLHAAAASLFVALWGPSGGVSLWAASVLQQFVAVDRLLMATLLTWLATFVLADDAAAGRDVHDWSAITGRAPATIFRARAVALMALTAVFVAVAMPALAAAADLSAASTGELIRQIGASVGFACLSVGITAITAIALRDRVAAWCTAMLCCAAAAVGIRLFDTTLMRAMVPAISGLILLSAAPLAVPQRKRRDGQ